MDSITSNLRVEDVPAQEARPFQAIGQIGEIETREVANGYVQVTVPLSYRLTAADQTDRTFYARILIKPHWLTQEFAQRAANGGTGIEANELISYNINIRGLMRGLFTGAGITEGTMEFGALTGRLVGFKTKRQKDNPTRLDVSYFFKPRV